MKSRRKYATYPPGFWLFCRGGGGICVFGRVVRPEIGIACVLGIGPCLVMLRDGRSGCCKDHHRREGSEYKLHGEWVHRNGKQDVNVGDKSN